MEEVADFSVMINGTPRGSFKGQSGLQQGAFPVSFHLLFINKSSGAVRNMMRLL
ncbi:hypothetical protein Sjap_021327 [Stephania japonica]|uniref:Uncharacterized protein n=1 Tax=Stephania japonica TaxID=461633 RepID=A0AAP0ELS1_9MAGN